MQLTCILISGGCIMLIVASDSVTDYLESVCLQYDVMWTI